MTRRRIAITVCAVGLGAVFLGWRALRTRDVPETVWLRWPGVEAQGGPAGPWVHVSLDRNEDIRRVLMRVQPPRRLRFRCFHVAEAPRSFVDDLSDALHTHWTAPYRDTGRTRLVDGQTWFEFSLDGEADERP